MIYWGVKRRDENIIQIWHFGECNINFYCTLINDIAQGACKRLYYTKPKCQICFIICLLLIQIK